MFDETEGTDGSMDTEGLPAGEGAGAEEQEQERPQEGDGDGEDEEAEVLSIFEADEQDPDLVDGGVWIELRPHFEAKIASANNDRYTNLYQERTRRLRSRIQRGTVKQSKLTAINQECYAQTVFLDCRGKAAFFPQNWKNKAKAGQPIKTAADRLDLMRFDTDLWLDIVEESLQRENYEVRTQREEAKN